MSKNDKNIPTCALDGTKFGICLRKSLEDNSDIENFSTNKLTNLHPDELGLLFKRYNIKKTGCLKCDTRNLFEAILGY